MYIDFPGQILCGYLFLAPEGVVMFCQTLLCYPKADRVVVFWSETKHNAYQCGIRILPEKLRQHTIPTET